MVAGLYLPSGVTVDHYFLPPYSTDEIVRRGIFQVQIAIADVIMVCPMFACFFTWPRSPFIAGVPHVPYL